MTAPGEDSVGEFFGLHFVAEGSSQRKRLVHAFFHMHGDCRLDSWGAGCALASAVLHVGFEVRSQCLDVPGNDPNPAPSEIQDCCMNSWEVHEALPRLT